MQNSPKSWYTILKRGDFLKKISKGKDPRNINLPKYNNFDKENDSHEMSHKMQLDSIWDGESIDEEKK